MAKNKAFSVVQICKNLSGTILSDLGLRPRLEPFLQGKSATLQKYQKGVFMVQSLKNLQNKQPRTGAFFCKPFRNLQGKFESFLLLTAEKKGSVRTRSGMTACEQGGKGLVDHSEACQ